jgi:hypothetical protein
MREPGYNDAAEGRFTVLDGWYAALHKNSMSVH